MAPQMALGERWQRAGRAGQGVHKETGRAQAGYGQNTGREVGRMWADPGRVRAVRGQEPVPIRSLFTPKS